MAWARAKALLHADTRAFELFSAASILSWACGFYSLEPFTQQSSYGRVDDFIEPLVMLAVLVPLALAHVAGILLECAPLRRAAIIASVAWWSWLAYLMYQYPPNFAATLNYTQLIVFNGWAFVAARLRGEVGAK